MPSGNRDYYKLLQVDPSADPEVIAAAYKRLAYKYHPDRNTSPDATLHMQEINAAYEILRDPAKREQYDRERSSRFSRAGRRYEENRRKRDKAEAVRRRAQEEQRRREQGEAERRQAEYERKQKAQAEEERRRRDEAEAARRRTEEEQRKREEKADARRRAYEEQRREQAESEKRRTEEAQRPLFLTDIRDGETVEIVDLHPEDSYYHERRRLIGSLIMVKNPLHRGNGWYCTHAYFYYRHDNELRQGAADGVLFGHVRLKRIARKEKGPL